ncbi:MAG: PIG-L family deacetylase [Pelosinus sp.]|nr:PIG-L family deacetylase [Pelosinus sp.]
MSILIVAAHPDDEVLGCGGMASFLAAKGLKIYSCILAGKAEARRHRPNIPELMNNINSSKEIIGFSDVFLGEFPNIQFNTVPHLPMVQFIEEVIQKTKAEYIFTHHPGDLNNDHVHTSLACQAASRLFQRKPLDFRLRGLYYMEILSATDWAFPGGTNQFIPDSFFEIGQQYLQQKIDALAAYEGIMRKYPHPRSIEALTGLAAYRGGQAGMHYAEAFQTAVQTMLPSSFYGGLNV